MLDPGYFGYVLQRLEGLRAGPEDWKARCPAHDDRDRSLNIKLGREGLLLKCHAGCSFQSVCSALGLQPKELFTKYHLKQERKPMGLTEYDYVDEEGVLLYQTCRKDPKGFFQRKPDGNGGWDNKLGDTRRVLYKLPELIAADPGRFVVVVEGEKDVDALMAANIVSTCNVGGAGKWAGIYSAFLAGRMVVIIPDNDPVTRNSKSGEVEYHDDGRPRRAGWDHACDAATSMLDHGVKKVCILLLPGLPEKGDVSDWIAAGNQPKDLKPLIDACKPFTGDEMQYWHPDDVDSGVAAQLGREASNAGPEESGVEPPKPGESPPMTKAQADSWAREAKMMVYLAEQILELHKRNDDRTFVLACDGMLARLMAAKIP